MTLPQYLDPFTSDTQDGTESQQGDNTAINVAVKYGRLPYTKLQGSVLSVDNISGSASALNSVVSFVIRSSIVRDYVNKMIKLVSYLLLDQ